MPLGQNAACMVVVERAAHHSLEYPISCFIKSQSRETDRAENGPEFLDGMLLFGNQWNPHSSLNNLRHRYFTVDAAFCVVDSDAGSNQRAYFRD